MYLSSEKRNKCMDSSDKQLHRGLFRRQVEMSFGAQRQERGHGENTGDTPAAEFVFHSTRHVFA